LLEFFEEAVIRPNIRSKREKLSAYIANAQNKKDGI